MIEHILPVIDHFLPIHVRNLLGKTWKLLNLVSYVNQQIGRRWLDTFKIFLNKTYFLELRWYAMYLATDYTIMLIILYTHAFSFLVRMSL